MARKPPSSSKRSARTYRSRPPRIKRLWRWVLGIIVTIILVIFLSGNRSLIKLYSLHNQKQNLEKQKEAVIKQKQQLEEEIEKLKNDDEHLEEEARKTYNMKKEKEEDYRVVPK
jgi:cell division protein FtsB